MSNAYLTESLGAKDDKGALVAPTTPASGSQNDTEPDEIVLQNNGDDLNTIVSSQFKKGSAPISFDQSSTVKANGIRIDQLCDILSREIGLVREESLN